MFFNFKQLCDKYWWAVFILSLYALIFSISSFCGIKLETILSYLTIFTGVFAIIALILTAKGLDQNIEQEKINRSWDCLKLYIDPSCRKVIGSVHVFLQLKKIEKQERLDLLVPTMEELEENIRKGKLNSDLLLKIAHCLNLKKQEIDKINNRIGENQSIEEYALCHFIELRSRVIFVQNLFEIIGTLYNKNQLDKKIIKSFFKSISIGTYKELDEIIQARRNMGIEKQPTAFKEWQTMKEDLEQESVQI